MSKYIERNSLQQNNVHMRLNYKATFKCKIICTKIDNKSFNLTQFRPFKVHTVSVLANGRPFLVHVKWKKQEVSSNIYFLLRTSVRACCSSCLGFDEARWFEYMLVLYCKSFRFCRLLPLWSNVLSACCSRNDTCKPTRQSAKTAVTKIFDVGRCSITLWSWRVGGEMIKPCIVHSAAKVHYHEYSIVYIRKFTFETSVNLAQIFLCTGHLYWLVCLWSGAFLGWIPRVQQS